MFDDVIFIFVVPILSRPCTEPQTLILSMKKTAYRSKCFIDEIPMNFLYQQKEVSVVMSQVASASASSTPSPSVH